MLYKYHPTQRVARCKLKQNPLRKGEGLMDEVRLNSSESLNFL
ncbi:hypothetical protein [Campylobacter troglodytis]|nr:hypothetical protein [Campylobacter troglodytis]